ncbi:MAG: dihydroorotate dehydrogenase electron transfer subunit [Lachnospiraceae bacterium]|nr:dihydroorotate dehydrogenase electron transfer subunit [Lachnospiraceae bacterium]
MKYVQGFYPILKKKNTANGIYEMDIHAPEIASRAVPGQFVHIGVTGHSLRRPISICRIDKEQGTIQIVFALKGQGTKDLAKLEEGFQLDVIGPLGNGFPLLESDKKVVLIGGGIGVPPMLGLSDYYKEHAKAITGFRDQSIIILQDAFAENGTETILCTDDGSAGRKGFVSQPLEEMLAAGEHVDMICACGPMPMLKVIAQIAEKYGVRCAVSLEQHMGCGIGACLVCSVPIKREGETEFLHVCKDGPVFDSKEVMW